MLAQLHQQGSLTTTAAAQLQKTVFVERFFDLFQYLKINPFQYIETNQIVSESDWLPHRRPQLGLSGLPPNEVYFPAWTLWQKWVKSGLKRVFPDYFVVVARPGIIFSQAAVTKSTLPASVIQKLLTDYADGTRTLRQISAQSEQDLLTLTIALMPLVRAGGLSLSPIPRLRKLRKLSGGAENFNTPEASFVYPGCSI